MLQPIYTNDLFYWDSREYGLPLDYPSFSVINIKSRVLYLFYLK